MLAIIATEPGDPDVLTLQEVDTPRPGPGEVLVKTAAVGVNRADLMQRQGHYPPPPGASSIIGLECSGEIAEIGFGVTGWEPGDACVALLAGGGYAEYVAVPEGQVIEPPDGIDRVTAGGLLEVAATVLSNLQLGDLTEGDFFLVHGGSSGIGSFAIQYAKSLSATVITTAGSEEKLAYCRSIGADLAISYRDEWAEATRDLTDGHGVDVILDTMGAKYLQQHVSLLAVNGRLMLIGMQGGTSGEVNLAQLLTKRAGIIGTTIRGRPVKEKSAICAAVAATIWPLVSSGAIRPAPQTVMRLDQAAAAHWHLESGDNLGKVILTVGD